MLTEQQIQRIAARIVASYLPDVVGLFGSYAIGRAHSSSDLDIFVIKETTAPPRDRSLAVRRALFGVMHPIDVTVFTRRELQSAQLEEDSFGQIVRRQARVLYERSPGAYPFDISV